MNNPLFDFDNAAPREAIRRRPKADPQVVHAYYGQLLGMNSVAPAVVRAYEKSRRQERLAERARKDRLRRMNREDY